MRSGNIGRRSAARERLELYRARLYGERVVSQGKLGELERASDGAAARLRPAEAAHAKGSNPVYWVAWQCRRAAQCSRRA